MKKNGKNKKIDKIEFVIWMNNYESFNKDAIRYWFREHNFDRLVSYLYGEREFHIGECFHFFDFNTKEIKDENGRALFERDLDDDFQSSLQIESKYYNLKKSDENNKFIKVITYYLIAPNIDL